MKQLTRKDLRQAASKVSPLKEEYVSQVLKEFFNVLTEALADGKSIMMHGAFTLVPVLRKGRPARNPRTMEPIYCPPHIGVKCVVHTGEKRVRKDRDKKVMALAEPFYREVENANL